MSRLIGYLLGFFAPGGVLVTFITHLTTKHGLKIIIIPILTIIFYSIKDLFNQIFSIYSGFFENFSYYICEFTRTISRLYNNNELIRVSIDVLRSVGFFDALYDITYYFQTFLQLLVWLFFAYLFYHIVKFFFYVVSKFAQILIS